MELSKETINLTEQSVKQAVNVMVEGDLVLPDVKPDIREVLLADANATVSTAEYQNGKLRISGNVVFSVLYAPDGNEDCELKSASVTFPFSDSLEISGGETLKFAVSGATEHIGFTLVNSRKLSAKVIVELSIRGYRERSYSPVSSISGGDMQCRTKTYQIYAPMAEEQTTVAVSDFLTVPADLPDIDEILKMDAWATAEDSKMMNGKVMVKGTLHIKTLYSAQEEGNRVICVSHEIPFAEIVEAGGAGEDCDVCVICNVKNATSSARGDINGDTKIISVSILMDVCIKSAKTLQETLVDDCYSTNGSLITKTEKMTFSEAISSEHTAFTKTQNVAAEQGEKFGELICVTCKPLLRETVFENGALHLKGSLISFLLYRQEGENGAVKSIVTETDFDQTKPVSGDGLSCLCELWLEDISMEKKGATEAVVKATMGLHYDVLREQNLDLLTECEQKEDMTEIERPSLVVYFTEQGDTLWDVAKRYGTTVEKIKTANRMEDDLLPVGKKILIPKAG